MTKKTVCPKCGEIITQKTPEYSITDSWYILCKCGEKIKFSDSIGGIYSNYKIVPLMITFSVLGGFVVSKMLAINPGISNGIFIIISTWVTWGFMRLFGLEDK